MVINIPHTLTKFEISTSAFRLRQLIKGIYGRFVLPFKHVMECDFHIHVKKNNVIVRDKNGQIVLSCDEVNVLATIVRCIRKLIILEDGWGILHGSAISFDGINIAFLGDSQAGKSTLITYLAHQEEVQFLSEDMLLINYKEKTICSCMNNVYLRKGGWLVLQRTKTLHIGECRFVNYKGFKRYEFVPPKKDLGDLPVHLFVSLSRHKDIIEGKIEKNEQNNREFFLNCSYLPYAVLANTIMAMSLEDSTLVYKLIYCDLKGAYEKLKWFCKKEISTNNVFTLSESSGAWITVFGISMKYLLISGDEVCCLYSQHYEVGDVVVFYYCGELLIHRIVKLCMSEVWCKGDNAFRLEKVKIGEIKGKVILRRRNGRISRIVTPSKEFIEKSLALGERFIEVNGNWKKIVRENAYIDFHNMLKAMNYEEN